MPLNGLNLLSPRRVHTTSSRALVLLWSMLVLASCSAESSDPVVARHMDAFFTAFTGRDLSRAELRQVTDEFVEVHTLRGRDPNGIREVARLFEGPTHLLRDREGTAAALALRHSLIATNYFNPNLQNTLSLRLLTEPDPVRVIDVASRRLMTERDVIALANIRHFARTKGAPRHKALSRRQVEEMVGLLNTSVGGKDGNMPQFCGDAAAFWAGVQQEWSDLNMKQQERARAYAAGSGRVGMPFEMYGRLLGLDPTTALSRHTSETNAAIQNMMRMNMYTHGLDMAVDSAFGR